MIEDVSLWHVTPVHIGEQFFDPTISALNPNKELYGLVNSPEFKISKDQFSKSDYNSLKEMHEFLEKLKNEIVQQELSASFCPEFPGIDGCIAKFQITASMYCYIMYNGTAVFVEFGNSIPFDDEKHFSLPVFYEKQKYEDDYCVVKEVTEQKKPLYDFLELMWKCSKTSNKYYSSSKKFRNNGVSYALFITVINAPSLVSNKLDESFLKNVNALLDTTPFTNIYDKNQWDLIKKRVDEYTIENPQIKELSENLIFADSWSGVVVAGDLKNNQTSLTWFMEFEIILQSMWLLFDAYYENILRQKLSTIELQGMLNRVEFMKTSLDNDISSNMEQSRHIMRNSLIVSSDINVIYSKMHGILENKLKIQEMSDRKTKSKYALLSDIALLGLAVAEIYGVIVELLSKPKLGSSELIAMAIMGGIAGICIWALVKGKK